MAVLRFSHADHSESGHSWSKHFQNFNMTKTTFDNKTLSAMAENTIVIWELICYMYNGYDITEDGQNTLVSYFLG